jgi:hypothetical protein
MSPPSPKRPPMPPTNADASVQLASLEANQGYQSLVSTSPTGLKRLRKRGSSENPGGRIVKISEPGP